MWTYKDSLNYGLLEQRIKRAGLMSKFKHDLLEQMMVLKNGHYLRK